MTCHVDRRRLLRPPSHQQGSCTATSRSGCWALRISGWEQSRTLREHRKEKNRVLALRRQGSAQRGGFTEPRLLPLPRRRKTLNSLTWAIWFSLISGNLLMVWLPGFCCKMHIHSDFSFPFPGSFSELTEMLFYRFVLCAVSQSCSTLLWPRGL